MNVKIYALKKDGGKFEKAVDFNPALISLGETIQEVIGNATFHEWASVLVEFGYKEKERPVSSIHPPTGERFGHTEVKFCPVHGLYIGDSEPCAEGTPADSVVFTPPPVFK